MESFGKRVYDLCGWHVELYVDAKELPPLESTLIELPKVSIDHLGLSEEGLPSLLRLVAKGVNVKATGFGRLTFNPIPAMQKIHQENPKALMFGTDLPSTRAKRPFNPKDIELIQRHFSPEDVERILWRNGVTFYACVK